MLKELRGIISWAAQLLLASVAPLSALIVLESALNTQDTLASQILAYLFLAVVGTGLGFVVSALNRNSVEVGIWIWVLPIIIEIWAIISQGSSKGGLVSVGYLFLAGPGRGEEGLGVVFVTSPTWSCCWYSAVMWWRRRRRRQSVPPPNSNNNAAPKPAVPEVR